MKMKRTHTEITMETPTLGELREVVEATAALPPNSTVRFKQTPGIRLGTASDAYLGFLPKTISVITPEPSADSTPDPTA